MEETRTRDVGGAVVALAPECFGAVLCYVDGPWAYFTTQPLAEQWGDDWDDAPYEHNAGRPYEWLAESDGRGCRCVHPEGVYCSNGGAACGRPGHIPLQPVPRWEVVRVAWEGPFDTPSDRHHQNSPFTVQQINGGAVPWLRPTRYARNHGVRIPAGTALRDFVLLVQAAGGVVYLPATSGADAPATVTPASER